MVQYRKSALGIRERTAMELAAVRASRQERRTEYLNGMLDYIAMMSDVELPEMDETEVPEDEQAV